MGLRVPWRGSSRLSWVLLIAVVCAGVAALGSWVIPPQYSATARLVASSGAPEEPVADRAAADLVYARTFAELLESPAVAERVTARLSDRLSPAEAVRQASITAVEGTAVVEVVAEGPDPQRAADLATTWAEVAAEEGADLVGVRNASLSLASPAAVPSAPERPRPLLYSALAAGGGVLGALVLVLLDRRSRRAEDSFPVEPTAPAADLPPGAGRLAALVSNRPSWPAVGAALVAAAAAVVTARLPVLSGPLPARVAVGLTAGALIGAVLAVVALVLYDRSRGLVLLSADAARATSADVVVQTTEPHRLPAVAGVDMRFRDLEPYRGLHRALSGRPEARVVLVVGYSAAARAALRAIDVAVSGANAGVRTVLVGTPSTTHRRSAGDVLRRSLEDDAVEVELVPTDRPHLRVLPLEWPDASDLRGREALESRRLPLLVDQLLASADFVVLSSPPLTDPEVPVRLAAVAHAAILVVVAGSSTVVECREAADRLARAGSRVIGVVLVQRGRAPRGPVAWVRPRQAVPAQEGVVGPRSPDESGQASALASALRDASTGSGRAGSRPAPDPTA